MTANECYRPPVDTQLRYTVQWFHEWSEMQRGDFLPVLAQKLAPGSYVNGLLSKVEALSCNEGRPPSLFQCRVKLFREWFETWGQAERDQLLGHIKSMDPGFYAKIQEALENLSSHGSSTTDAKTNGLEDTPDENQFSDEVQIEAKDEKPAEAEDVADLQLNSDDPRDEEEALDKEDEAPTI